MKDSGGLGHLCVFVCFSRVLHDAHLVTTHPPTQTHTHTSNTHSHHFRVWGNAAGWTWKVAETRALDEVILKDDGIKSRCWKTVYFSGSASRNLHKHNLDWNPWYEPDKNLTLTFHHIPNPHSRFDSYLLRFAEMLKSCFIPFGKCFSSSCFNVHVCRQHGEDLFWNKSINDGSLCADKVCNVAKYKLQPEAYLYKLKAGVPGEGVGTPGGWWDKCDARMWQVERRERVIPQNAFFWLNIQEVYLQDGRN